MRRTRFTRFFDKLEDKIRGFLSGFPIIYAFIGGVAIVLFWRGVWHSADMVIPFLYKNAPEDVYNLMMALDAPLTLLIAFLMLLGTGLMVTHFIGNEIIISGLKHEKKLEEKEAEEIETEEHVLKNLAGEIKKIREDIEEIKLKIK